MSKKIRRNISISKSVNSILEGMENSSKYIEKIVINNWLNCKNSMRILTDNGWSYQLVRKVCDMSVNEYPSDFFSHKTGNIIEGMPQQTEQLYENTTIKNAINCIFFELNIGNNNLFLEKDTEPTTIKKNIEAKDFYNDMPQELVSTFNIKSEMTQDEIGNIEQEMKRIAMDNCFEIVNVREFIRYIQKTMHYQ